jgi:hypothetical protein
MNGYLIVFPVHVVPQSGLKFGPVFIVFGAGTVTMRSREDDLT